ncbi:MAG: T9SS C-terminal target domain-containing protein [Calditrichaeota bacterium]|nr:MAG: T9SS C-terminal target domain-containing protein [Calditrichota bacterium]
MRKEVCSGACHITSNLLFSQNEECVMKKVALVLSIVFCMFVLVTPASSQIFMDGDASDWAGIDAVDWVDNVDGLFPAEVGALVNDIVDIKSVQTTIIGNQIFAKLDFWGGPAWPNNGATSEKDGVTYNYSRGYYHVLYDLDNDATTGWNVSWYETHYTPVGYLESQSVADAVPIGAELMTEWGARYYPEYDGGGVRNMDYWAADYSEYNGQTDTGSDYEIFNLPVPAADSAKGMMWQGSTKINSSDHEPFNNDNRSFWAGHGWGNDFLEYGIEITPLKEYYEAKGVSYFNEGDVIAFCGMTETPIDDWGVDITTRGEFVVPAIPRRPSDITFDGDDSDWGSAASVDWVDNVDGLFPAEVGALVTDIVDIKETRAFATTDALYFLLRFWGGPAWPNNAADTEKDGVTYYYSRGYYHLLVDSDNDATTGWNVAWYETHYTPVGYLESQSVAGAEPIGAEMMFEWGARTYPEYDGGGMRNLDYWAADFSEYNGQTDTGSDYDMFEYSVVDADSALALGHDGLLLNHPSVTDGQADWMAHAWGHDFIEVGIGLRATKDYFMGKDGSEVFKEGDVMGFAGFTETPMDDWGVDITTRGEFTVSEATGSGTGGEPSGPFFMDGDDSDWADGTPVAWVDNVDGLFPAEVGALVNDIVDIKEVQTTIKGNQIFAFLRFWGGPAWPNNGATSEKDGVTYNYSRGYYHVLYDLDNDATTGWNVSWYETHYTPVGYLESQSVADAVPIGAELMTEWGARYYPEYDGGGVRNMDYWAADYSEYNGQTDTGSDYEIFNLPVPAADSAKGMMWQGSTKINSSDHEPFNNDNRSFWAGHGWGNDFIEYGIEITPLKEYYEAKGVSYFNEGDVIAFCGMTETPIDDWGVDITTRGEFVVPAIPRRPSDITFDGDDSDWGSAASVDWVDNVDGLFPAEVGALVTDIVDIKETRAFATTDALYFLLRFWGGPAWPNNAADTEKDGVTYYYSRGYYHLLVDSDNDATTGWNVAWYETHYTPVGYLESQSVAGAEPIGAEMMFEWGARTYPEYDGGGMRNLDYWAADFSEYNGQTDTGSDYDMFEYSVVDADSALALGHDGLLLNHPSVTDGQADWMAHAWGHDFIEVGIGLRATKDYFMGKDGSEVFKEGDVMGFAGFTETPMDDWGVDITTRGEFTVTSSTVSVSENPLAIVDNYALGHNYPNPFNPETTIDYTIAKTGNANIVIYNVLGQKVRTLINGVVEAGTHSITWNGKNAFGISVPSGVYYYTLKSNSFKQTKKMLLLK